MVMAKKLSRGRQKVELKKIESIEDRLVTFSKRRSGIYKKATEMSTMCGVEIGILVFSPSGNAFTFGIPNLQQVAARLLHPTSTITSSHDDPIQPEATAGSSQMRNTHVPALQINSVDAVMEEMNASYNELSTRLYRLRKEAQVLARRKREIEDFCWWEVDIEDLSKKEVDQLTGSMEELKRTADQRLLNINTSLVAVAVAPAAVASSSSSSSLGRPGSPSDSMMSTGSSPSSSEEDDPPNPIAGTSNAVPYRHEDMDE